MQRLRRTALWLVVWGMHVAVAQPLVGGVSTQATQLSLTSTSVALRSAYSLQSTALQDNLFADADLYGTQEMSVAVSGRDDSLSGVPSAQSSHLGLLVSWRLSPVWRMGAYMDQTLASVGTGQVSSASGQAALGGYAVWAPQDGMQVRFSAGRSAQNLVVRRSGDGGAEAGVGETVLTSIGYQVVASYDANFARHSVLRSYLGVRYLRVGDTDYAETHAVSTPLNFDALVQESTTVLAGLQAKVPWSAHTRLVATAGLEQDVGGSNGQYSGTNPALSGLQPVTFNTLYNATRSTLGMAIEHQWEGLHRLHFGVTLSEQAFASQAILRTTLSYVRGF